MVILVGMTSMKVGPKGQVVIPKRVRDRLGIRPGDRVLVEEGEAGSAVLRRLAPVSDLLGLLADGPGSVGMQDWEEEKRRERELEKRKEARWEADFPAGRNAGS